MPSLDFDGDYGRTYRKSIQDSIPGHAVLHEIARAAIQATASDAQQVLVVGPGPGDELPHLLNACADAGLTVLEPSELMLEQCRKTVRITRQAAAAVAALHPERGARGRTERRPV